MNLEDAADEILRKSPQNKEYPHLTSRQIRRRQSRERSLGAASTKNAVTREGLRFKRAVLNLKEEKSDDKKNN